MKLRESKLISNYKIIGCYASDKNNKVFSKAFLACWSDFIKSNFSQGLNSSCLWISPFGDYFFCQVWGEVQEVLKAQIFSNF